MAGRSAPGRRKPERPLPDDFVVTDAMKAWFAEQPWRNNVPQPGVETEAFKENAIAHDRRYRDWEAAWRQWMRNQGTRYATTAGGGRAPGNLHTADQPTTDALASRMTGHSFDV